MKSLDFSGAFFLAYHLKLLNSKISSYIKFRVMKPLIISVLIILSSLHLSYAQEGYEYNDQIQVLYGVVFNGDTIPVLNIPEISITGHKFENQQDEYWYKYYLKRVKKVYPYYQIAKTVVNDLEDEKDNLKDIFNKNLGKDKKDDRIKTFAFDRMKSLDILPDSFINTENFDKYFTNCYGIVSDRSVEIESVKIIAKGTKAKYIHRHSFSFFLNYQSSYRCCKCHSAAGNN